MGREPGAPRRRARMVAAGVAAALAATVLSGCSLFGLEEETALECPGEVPPSSAPGEARILLTIAEGTSNWDLTTVIYDDGTVALLAGEEPTATNAVGMAGSLPRYAGGPYA